MSEVYSELEAANSLHPKIKTTIQINEKKNCHFDIVYVLPASVFVDPYQLQDLAPLIGKATVFGEHDLELPLEKVKEWRGSIVFLRQETTSPVMQVTLPLHLRYQQPSEHLDKQPITIQAPWAGWTCGGGSDSLWPPIEHELISSPQVDSSAIFRRLSNDPTPLILSVPIGKVQDATVVTYGTFVSVVLCTLWIVYAVYLSVRKRRRLEAKGKRRKSE
ncbi:hypothetical protein INT47_002743 [Mucor saturninus]|uniref:Protein PBN1 n=1 Tax=Mucor saturninus TaxID=64648 RepID=A0A8H7QSF6_9FUNG|nr:hypothetical protein INT47_002743 [Mucor saturninus]